MKLVFPIDTSNPDAEDGLEWPAIKHRSHSMPILAAALFAGVDLSNAYEYAHAYLSHATSGAVAMLQSHQVQVDNLEALCIEVGPKAAIQFHQELHRAFIEGRVRQSAFK